MLSFCFCFVALISFSLCQSPPFSDECQLLNATEPPECPQHIGPPCPPCITNLRGDYENGDALNISDSTRQSIIEYQNKYLIYWLDNWPPHKIWPLDVPSSIVEGSGGRALIFLRMYQYTKNETYLSISKEYIDAAIDVIPLQLSWLAVSYMTGYSGVWTVAAQIANIENNQSAVNMYLELIQSIFDDVDEAINNNQSRSNKYNFDMLDGCHMTGIAGLLYNAMLLNEYFGNNTIHYMYLMNISHYLITSGLQYNKNYIVTPDRLLPGCFLPGSSEGNGGIIKMLLTAYNKGYVNDLFSNSYYKTAIINTLNWFVNIQLLDGNIPTYTDIICSATYGNDSDARVQWCHGAPGFIDTMSLAAVIFDSIGQYDDLSDIYLNSALLAYNTTWNRGLLIKGLMHCHGVTGNAYTLWHIYKNLNMLSNHSKLYNKYDIEFIKNQSLWRTIQFIEWTLNDNNLNHLRTNYSNQDSSMWLGSYGIPLLYIQAIQHGFPQNIPVCMVGWDICNI